MLIRILLVISLAVALYKGLERYGVIGDKAKAEKKEFTKLIDNWDKRQPTTTNQVKGTIKNINQLTPQDLSLSRRNQIQAKFPDITLVFGAENSRWLAVLQEEDFTILRELRAKLDQNAEITEEDIRRFKLLEDKGVIQAIKSNNPEVLKISRDNPSQEIEVEEPPLEPQENFDQADEPEPQPEVIEEREPETPPSDDVEFSSQDPGTVSEENSQESEY